MLRFLQSVGATCKNSKLDLTWAITQSRFALAVWMIRELKVELTEREVSSLLKRKDITRAVRHWLEGWAAAHRGK